MRETDRKKPFLFEKGLFVSILWENAPGHLHGD
jgi:hypothetical protein